VAPPRTVYSILADYRIGHPRILPKEFGDLRVECGGSGEGTIISFEMRAFGSVRRCRAAITEPDPGRVLMETDLGNSGFVTTFTVTPASGGTSVTITTAMPAKRGFLAALERFFAERFLQRVYRKELGLLNYAAQSA
jgi:hypothetical protein